MITGQWPYQSTPVRRGFLIVLILTLASQMLPMIMAIIKYHHDWEFILESACPLIVSASIIVKLMCSVWNSQKVSCIQTN